MKDTAITMMGQRRPGEGERRRAMVRLNGVMFYSVAVASFFESVVPLDATRLLKLAEGHGDVRPWLEQEWLTRRAELGALLRDYLYGLWPEFDWDAAFQEFRASWASRPAARVGPPGTALEILARCVTEASITVFYRTLAKSADDPALRELAHRAEQVHAGYFATFRAFHQRVAPRWHAGLPAACRAVITSCRSAREVDLALAFQPLAHHWHGGWVFPELTYTEFLGRLAPLLKRHGELGPVQRFLFSPWLNPPRKLEPPLRLVKAGSVKLAAPTGAAHESSRIEQRSTRP